MARARRICAKTGCPHPADGRYCTTHNAAYEAERGSREARGYDHRHREVRKQWAPKVAQGNVTCAKCKQAITSQQRWHLGHTDDRTAWTGPEHEHCNLSDAGRRSHQTK